MATSETPVPPALAEMAGFLVAKVHAIFHLRSNEVLGPGALTIRHFGALTVIADQGPLSQAYLAALVRVDRTTMVAIVDELEERGLIHRRRNPDDRRAYALEATDAGRAWIAEKRDELIAAQEDLLAPLTATERRALVKSLYKVLVSQPAELVADPAVKVRTG